MEEMTGEWRKSHSEKLCVFVLFTKHIQGDQIKEDDMGRACGMHGEKKKWRGHNFDGET
jgi:hypothetical protein